MNCRCSSAPHHTRRALGGVLIEIIIAVALFVGAAGFTLGAMRSVFDGMDREDRRLHAVDLARSLMAELEARLINVADLRGPIDGRVGSRRASGGIDEVLASDADQPVRTWRVEVHTDRSRFAGLSLVELTVREESAASEGRGEPDELISVTLRQLLPLRESASEGYEQDEMVEDLPEIAP